MSTAVEKRMLSIEEIEAQTALVLPQRELMWHRKHHHHHHHQQVQIIVICINNQDHHHEHMGENMGEWNNGGWWGGNEGENFGNNEGCFPFSPFGLSEGSFIRL